MTVRYVSSGALQYQGVEGAAALAWLETWLAQHGDDIREHEGNGHDLINLVPPHDEGCVTQLNLEYHFETATFQDYQDLHSEIGQAIVYGGVATADCDYNWASSSES